MSRFYSHFRRKISRTRSRSFSITSRLNHTNKVPCDIIGPPDPVSNLRPILFKRPPNETKLEKFYRESREETQRWNQKFWTQHNIRFTKERKQFQEDLKASGKISITSDEMSVFYKKFLDKNWRTHLNYNIEWYKRNVKLLGLELLVRISKLKFK